ncbi:hypothetical protein FHT87_004785 [Rhizobium sp. BK316]|uniref:hypothetical protein n=1 Tax=Rhizobium sp. BK316 TaxID=2587053 RepID=UPI00160D55A0|nr:hypothetical protein [Rhizobium sp. BK316]MBB3410838.1 hypothetical protein [Rhizobium sp. BK316]
MSGAYNDRKIDEFENILKRTARGLPLAMVHFCAVKINEKFQVIQARLFLEGGTPPETSFYESRTVVAGRFSLPETGLSPIDFIRSVHKGDFVTPKGTLAFAANNGGARPINIQPFHPAANQGRLAVLTISGATMGELCSRPLIDWELRGADEPYDSLDELLLQFRLGTPGQETAFDAVIQPVLEVDFACAINGEDAEIGVVTSAGTPHELVKLGYRVFNNKREITARGSFAGNALNWHEDVGLDRGRGHLNVAVGSIIQCFASFDGEALHHGYIVDPKHGQNDRRSTFEVSDPGLQVMTELLLRTSAKGGQSRDTEGAVAWLLWLLGFNPNWIGFLSKLQEAPDLIATTPRGDYVVVEVTMGMLKTENKLATLIGRAARVKETLTASGYGHIRVLPLIVTTLPRDQVVAEIEPAEKSGARVCTRETLVDAIERTVLLPDANRIFDEAYAEITAALAPKTE